MMRSLFHAFERHGVRYLVISGQASVLYGAALFSQDLDLWVEPKKGNVAATRRALHELRARGRAYWTPILDELRQLRATGRLLPEGSRI